MNQVEHDLDINQKIDNIKSILHEVIRYLIKVDELKYDNFDYTIRRYLAQLRKRLEVLK